jgi:DNA-binding transcriptional LysR family regulator
MSTIDPLYDQRMETRLLEYFVVVADERNVTAASARLFAAQSTVSAGLASLERDLGVRLFERTSKSVAPTPAGEALLPLARAVLDDLDALRQVASESETGLRGRIRMGTFPGLHVIDLPTVLGAFRRSHPLVDIRLSVSPAGSSGLFDDLERDRLDAALTALPPAADLESWPLASYSFVALLPPGHALAARDPGTPVALSELAAEDWVDVLPGYGNRVQLDAELARRGISRRIAAEVGELPSVAEYVAAGLGVAVVPDIAPEPGSAGARAVVRAVADDLPRWTLSLTVGRAAGRRPHVRALLDALRTPPA